MSDSPNRIDSMEDLEALGGESYLDYLCAFQRHIQVVFLLSAFFMVLSLLGVLFLEPGTASHVIATVNAVTLVVFGTASGTALYVCKRRE